MITSSLIFCPLLFSWYMTVLCFALPLALPLTVYFESYSALSSSLAGVLGTFLLFLLHPIHEWSEAFLRLHCQLMLMICISTLFFSDLIPLVKMHISEHLYNSPPEIADDNYWYQGFFFLPKALRSLIL